MFDTNTLATEPATKPSHRSRQTPARLREDRALFDRLRDGDDRARSDLAERFMPLARSLARRYESSGEPLEDLVQVASLALVKAIDRFDASRGTAFSSFAVPTIVGELKRHFRDRTWAVRPPRDLQELILRIDRTPVRAAREQGRSPTVAELAEVTGAGEEQILEALQARTGRGSLSLQSPRPHDPDGATLEDAIGTDDDGFDVVEARVVIGELCTGLPPRSREILRLRFEQDMTQSQIGASLGISQMQVSRILRQTLLQLQDAAAHDERALAMAGAAT